MNDKQACEALRTVNLLAAKAKSKGKHPFAAVLIAEDAETMLLSASNISTVRHAEIELAREAAEMYDADFLWRCTTVSYTHLTLPTIYSV